MVAVNPSAVAPNEHIALLEPAPGRKLGQTEVLVAHCRRHPEVVHPALSELCLVSSVGRVDPLTGPPGVLLDVDERLSLRKVPVQVHVHADRRNPGVLDPPQHRVCVVVRIVAMRSQPQEEVRVLALTQDLFRASRLCSPVRHVPAESLGSLLHIPLPVVPTELLGIAEDVQLQL